MAPVRSTPIGRWRRGAVVDAGTGPVADRHRAGRDADVDAAADQPPPSVQAHRPGESFQRPGVRRFFLSACKVQSLARLRTLTMHHGRHTFIGQALADERTLAEFRIAAGQMNPAVTGICLHVAAYEDDSAGNLFGAR
jgi:hypothetical protein